MDDALLATLIAAPESLSVEDLETFAAALTVEPQLRRRLADHRWHDERCSRLLHPHRADFSARVRSALADGATGPRFIRRVTSATRPRHLHGRQLLAWAAVVMVGVAIGLLTSRDTSTPAAAIVPPPVTWRSSTGALGHDAPHQVPVGTSLHLDDDHGSRIQIDGPAQLTLTTADTFTLAGGQLRAELVPGAPRWFHTGPVTVEVLGTIFALGEGAAGPWVLVERGLVACRADGGAPQRLGVGDAWIAGIGPLVRVQEPLSASQQSLHWFGSTNPAAPVRLAIERVPGAEGVSLACSGVPSGSIPWVACSWPTGQDWRAAAGIGLWHRGDHWQLELTEGLLDEPVYHNRHQERFAADLPASTTWRWTFLPWTAFARRTYQEPEPQHDGLSRDYIIALSWLAVGATDARQLDVQDLTVLAPRPSP